MTTREQAEAIYLAALCKRFGTTTLVGERLALLDLLDLLEGLGVLAHPSHFSPMQEPTPDRKDMDYDRCKGKLQNCVILNDGKDSEPLFIQRPDETIVANLDGFAIIPKAEYERLTQAQAAGHDVRPEAPQATNDEKMLALILLNFSRDGAGLPPVDEPSDGPRYNKAQQMARAIIAAGWSLGTPARADAAVFKALRECQVELCPDFDTCEAALKDGERCACGFEDGPFANAVPKNRTAERLRQLLHRALAAINPLPGEYFDTAMDIQRELGACQQQTSESK